MTEKERQRFIEDLGMAGYWFASNAVQAKIAEDAEWEGLAIRVENIADMNDDQRRRAENFWTFPQVASLSALPISLYHLLISAPPKQCPNCHQDLTPAGIDEFRKIEMTNAAGLLAGKVKMNP